MKIIIGSDPAWLRFVIILLPVHFLVHVQEGYAQISPGELSAAHADLEGISNCDRCHEGKGKLSDESCLDCHGEIRIQLDEKHGYHWLMTGGPGRKACGQCHAEHNGRKYDLIYWEGGIERFEHERAGYTLQGKHRDRKCRDCHRMDRIARNLKALNSEINLDRTYLGLDRSCTGCHEDIHRAQFDRKCDNCHGVESWRPTLGFAHEQSRYPLTGRHTSVSCERCHYEMSGGESGEGVVRYIRYRGLPFDECSDCHSYRHRSDLGRPCSSCHATDGWKSFDRTSFDHGKTRFPLRGRHAGVRCDSCHRGETREAGLRFERCVDCHRDIHLSGFRSERFAGECESCHGEDRFIPSTYGPEEHDRSVFPLEGAHRAIPCTACHKRGAGSDQILFRIESKECESCHRDPHRGQFSKKQYPGCPSCHGPDRWDHLHFDHQVTAFPLDGRHVKVRCDACHKVAWTVDRERFVRYTPLDRSCRSCHAEEPAAFFNEEVPFDREKSGN